jgi:glycolate oxidase FAD binding subunit
VTTPLPITETLEPADQAELAAAVQSCYAEDRGVYTVGGGTSLGFGRPATKAGIAISLSKLNRVVDYPARDMTITVDAGMSMKALSDELAKERQRLPIDVPQSDQATVGGVIATNFNGPRRYGMGTVRDYVIGISAIDGRGISFKGGGRVVKNVAGYDFCKLLTGSMGTIGVIHQVTLKLKPLPERLAIMICSPRDFAQADSILAALVHSQTTPVSIALLANSTSASIAGLKDLAAGAAASNLFLVVAMEGTDVEVRWMIERLGREWWDQSVAAHHTLFDADARTVMQELIEFPAAGESPMVLKASVPPSAVTRFMQAARDLDPKCLQQAYAGNGIIFVRLSQAPPGGMTKGLIGRLQSAASAGQGTLVVLSSTLGEATHQSVWGTLSSPQWLLNAVKREFDPRNILNPGRFVYA